MKKPWIGQFWWGALVWSLATLFAYAEGTPAPAAAELSRLQGYWEGEGAGGKCAITIAGNSLHYQVGKNWFATTFVLPANTNPPQLHATIQDCWPPSKESIGSVVFAIYKIEDGTLTIAVNDTSDSSPDAFADASSRYVVKKVPRPVKTVESPAPK